MSFPTTLPSYTVTAGTESANSAGGGTGLSPLLNAFETDIMALGVKLGTGSSTAAANQLLVGTGAGTSAWQGLTSAQLASIVSDETGSGALVFGNSPTIVTPTIASFTNANHNHTNSAGGGQLTGSTALVNSSVTADKLSTGVSTATVATSQTTASTTMTDLATVGPSVTVTIGANGLALVIMTCGISNSASNATRVGYAVSGNSTVAASDSTALVATGTNTIAPSVVFLATGLTAGSNTFTLKYDVSGGTGTFSGRVITVLPL